MTEERRAEWSGQKREVKEVKEIKED